MVLLEKARVRIQAEGKKDRFFAKRFLAKWIDLFLICFLAACFVYPIGILAAFFYGLFGDGLSGEWKDLRFAGQSVGKKILGLQVRGVLTQRPIRWREAALRNIPIAIALFFILIPVWGWMLSLLIGIPLFLLETYWMLTLERGRRLGDILADTEVIELPS